MCYAFERKCSTHNAYIQIERNIIRVKFSIYVQPNDINKFNKNCPFIEGYIRISEYPHFFGHLLTNKLDSKQNKTKREEEPQINIEK